MASIERRSGKRRVAYVVRFRDDTGRQRSRSFGSHVEALRYSSRVETQLLDGDWIDPARGRETFGNFHKRWIDARSVSPSRAATEASQAKNHILPTWEGIALAKITPLRVDTWLTNLPTGPTTKRMALAQFRLCLQAAVREGILRTNPAATTKAPSLQRKRVNKNDVLDAYEIDQLVGHTPERWKALIFLSAWLGWRWSEAMGLRWRDVDLAAGVVYVGGETVVEVGGILHVREGGKTDAATRTVPLPRIAADVLRWHRDGHTADGGPDGRVFVTEGGRTPLRSNFRRVFQRAVVDAGLDGRGLTMRQLRHSAATLMLSHGLDVLDVQERLGHARGSVTLDVYGRVLAGRRTAATQRLDALMSECADVSFASTKPDEGSGMEGEPRQETAVLPTPT